MQKHRKLAAIMFTDIVGYTALMSKDEDNALRILHKNRDIVKLLVGQFNGELLKEMGDGNLCCFPSVVDAVNCALEIQNSLRDETEFKLRIGIHIGDVVVEEGGDVFGDGVNVASRIENLAEPGGICISERVYYDIRNKPVLQVAFLGEKTLKNVDYPVKIYALTRGDTPSSMSKPSVVEDSSAKKTGPSIAVLPFTNMSADPEQDYFCDGMAEEIINALAHVEGLLVVARNSTFAFKDQHPDIREVGRKLNVETVLEGSVRKAGNRLRITAQLINVADGYHLWSERYDRELEDVFAIQDEISLAIVEKLKVKLLSKEKAAIEKRYTENLEAYNLYLLGSKSKGIDVEKRIEHYQKAIELDPDFALAYVKIAHHYFWHYSWRALSKEECYHKAKEALGKALEIDNNLSESHSLLAIMKMYDWDWEATEQECKRAIELNPGNEEAHQFFAYFLMLMNRSDEALKETKLSQKLNPLYMKSYSNAMMIYCNLGRYNDALDEFNKGKAIAPDWCRLYTILGLIYCKQGKYKKAIEAHKKAYKLSNSKDELFDLGETYAYAGEREKAEVILNELLESKEKIFERSSFIHRYYIAFGEYDKAFEWLDRAYEERDPGLHFVKTYIYDPIRSDPRFKALLKKMGLPE